MPTVEVTVHLPFFLRWEGELSIPYDTVCLEARLEELAGQTILIATTRRTAGIIDNAGSIFHERTTIRITAQMPLVLSEDSMSIFAIRNCLDVVNKLITSYQASTGEVSNAGFILPLGTADMQLFAEIKVDNVNIRDRWPTLNINTFPLSKTEADEFRKYLIGEDPLPLCKLFKTNAVLALELGQYPLAVVQAAIAVESRATQVISKKLLALKWQEERIAKYAKLTLGNKLKFGGSDPRSLELYFKEVVGFPQVLNDARQILIRLRNDVVHNAYLASHDEAISAVRIATKFLTSVG